MLLTLDANKYIIWSYLQMTFFINDGGGSTGSTSPHHQCQNTTEQCQDGWWTWETVTRCMWALALHQSVLATSLLMSWLWVELTDLVISYTLSTNGLHQYGEIHFPTTNLINKLICTYNPVLLSSTFISSKFCEIINSQDVAIAKAGVFQNCNNFVSSPVD